MILYIFIGKLEANVISYKPFFDTLKRKGISQYALINKLNFSKGTLDRIKSGKPLNATTIQTLCNLLGCTSNDIILITPDDK